MDSIRNDLTDSAIYIDNSIKNSTKNLNDETIVSEIWIDPSKVPIATVYYSIKYCVVYNRVCFIHNPIYHTFHLHNL